MQLRCRAMVALLSTYAQPLPSELRTAKVLYWPASGRLDSEWSEALAPFAVRVVDDAGALARAAASGDADVIVCSWHAELPALASKLTLPIVVVGAVVPEALVDAVVAGAPIRHVARPAALGDELRQLTRAARAAVARHALDGMTVSWRGARVPAKLADLSCDGLSFIVEDEALSALLPGRDLGELEVRRGDARVLQGVTARVRHIEPLDPPGRYRIGCALSLPPAPSPAPSLVRDRALCAALLKAGLRGGVLIAPLDAEVDASLELQLGQARLDVAAGVLRADDAGRQWPELGLVRGRFEVAGRVYRFTSVVTGRAPLTMTLPTALEESQLRASARYRPSADDPVTVELRSALADEPLDKTLVDLSASGFSFVIDGARELFPLGLKLQVSLRIGGEPLVGAGRVRTFVREGEQLRCGVELVGLAEAAQARLSDYLMRRRFPDVEDGGAVPFDELAAFLRTTGFLYPAKEAVLAPIMSQVQHTFEQLYGGPSRLFKSVVARHDGELAGHVSSVRVYQQTWMSQHLAATSSRHVSHLLNLGAAEYFGHNPDLEFFKIYFQRDIRWPSRVFGGFARTLRNVTQSNLREFRHLTFSTSEPLPMARPDDVEVMEASEEDLALVERHFVRKESSLVLESDDLLRHNLTLAPLNKQFARLGLYRRRRVLLAMRRGVCLGFALAEVSSPGLNLSEALSMFNIHVTDDGEACAQAVRAALLHAVHGLYRQAGRPFAGGLVRPSEVAGYAELGVETDDTWLVWTCHRALYPRFCDYVDRLFDVLRRRGGRKERAAE
jgi:PilZ domain-containing protein